jgi:hypothetical protein
MLVSANNFNYIKPDREHSNLQREISWDDFPTNAPEELVPDPKEAARH